MTVASSQDLHPEQGARYVFERAAGEALRYRVAVHVAGGATVMATLEWDEGERARIEPAVGGEIGEEIVRLARALRNRAPARMVRWRG